MATPSIAAGEGRTRWRRFGLVGGIGLAAVALIGYLAMTGALALTFSFSGIPFTLKADKLVGSHFVQYAYPDKLASGAGAASLNAGAQALIGTGSPIPNTTSVGSTTYASDTVTQLRYAEITGLNQAICAPALPGWNIKVVIAGTGTTPTTANNLVIQAPALTADSANFANIDIGIATGSALLKQGFSPGNDYTDPYGALSGEPIGGSFAQDADTVTLTNIRQIGVGTEAGSFNISGLRLYASFVSSCG